MDRETMKKETPKKPATMEIIFTKYSTSRAMGVSISSIPEAKSAIRPMHVLSPTATTRPFPVPAEIN